MYLESLFVCLFVSLLNKISFFHGFCLFVCLFVCWNTTRKTTLGLLCWEGSKPHGSDHTRAEAQTTYVPKTAVQTTYVLKRFIYPHSCVCVWLFFIDFVCLLNRFFFFGNLMIVMSARPNQSCMFPYR